jgi:hypothetical protein
MSHRMTGSGRVLRWVRALLVVEVVTTLIRVLQRRQAAGMLASRPQGDGAPLIPAVGNIRSERSKIGSTT